MMYMCIENIVKDIWRRSCEDANAVRSKTRVLIELDVMEMAEENDHSDDGDAKERVL